ESEENQKAELEFRRAAVGFTLSLHFVPLVPGGILRKKPVVYIPLTTVPYSFFLFVVAEGKPVSA
ncbi:MAG TPA: hypothetical protein PKA48_17540, partial [Candidatus Obscuribacter sp.]|nr:hypothetical protein [Candidatus Obscuribacter sp.]